MKFTPAISFAFYIRAIDYINSWRSLRCRDRGAKHSSHEPRNLENRNSIDILNLEQQLEFKNNAEFEFAVLGNPKTIAKANYPSVTLTRIYLVLS